MDELARRRDKRNLLSAADELEKHARTLRTMAGEDEGPARAAVEFTEIELAYLVERMEGLAIGPNADLRRAIWAKLDRALMVETGPGGRFSWRGDPA